MKRKGEIGKKAVVAEAFRRPCVPFMNARSAFFELIGEAGLGREDVILMPSYIGWSEREGSGVFDPVARSAARFEFYRMTADLSIDVEDFRQRLRAGNVRLVLFIHYFGWPDPNLAIAAKESRELGAIVVEDEAHAMLTDLVSGKTGRHGDAAIFSLHKVLPFASGGLLVINDSMDDGLVRRLVGSSNNLLEGNPLDYDLMAIAERRRENAEYLSQALEPLAGMIDPLHPALPPEVVPQTYPVIIRSDRRDDLYHELNRIGYGVVSLYHTLIGEIDAQRYADSHWLSKHIMNLPVHQDTTVRRLEGLVQTLEEICALKKN